MPQDRLPGCLAEAAEVRRLLVADPFRSIVSRALRRGWTGRRVVAGSSTVTPFRLRRRLPHEPADVQRVIEAYGRRLSRSATRAGLESPVLITDSPFVAAWASVSGCRRIVYYAIDDWLAHPACRPTWPAHRAANAELRRRGVDVVAVSQTLLDRLDPSGRGLVVPNGVDEDEFAAVGHLPRSPLLRSRGPTAVYVGHVDGRLSPTAVEGVVRGLDGGELVVAGRVGPGAFVGRFRGRSDIRFVGHLPRADVVALLAGADLGIIPHRRNEQTATMSPLKAYEYVAAGLPVVAIRTDPLESIVGPIDLVDDDRAESWESATRAALDHGGLAERDRVAFVESVSWRRRYRNLIDFALAP